MNTLSPRLMNRKYKIFFVSVFQLALCFIFSLSANVGASTEAEKRIENNCRSCHGVDGKAEAESWPNLICQNRGYLYNRMITLKHNNEHDIDKTIKDLSLMEIDAISRYYSKLECPVNVRK
ncbi:MAG: cytochrome c553 [Cellvibrionaceae bacterium]|jgi:cytochrome c553